MSQPDNGLTLGAGGLREALHQVLPRRLRKTARHKAYPITLKFHQTRLTLEVLDAKHEVKGSELPVLGTWPERAQVDGNQLRAVLDKITAKSEIVLSVSSDHLIVLYESSRLAITRLDGEGKKGIVAKPLPPQAHKGPVAVPPDPAVKRVALNDTWAFSARVPMPQHRNKKD